MGFTLVLLTTDGRLILSGEVGDIPTVAGSVEQPLQEKATERISLFEDVFGRSAFKDLEAPSELKPLQSMDNSFGAVLDLRLLEGPAHLLPPMQTLYMSLMNGLLLKPQTEDVDIPEDQEMQVDPPPLSPLEPVASRIIRRQVQETEINLFADFFKQQQAIFGESILLSSLLR